ncbi:disease resistance protein RGA2-like isoform X2 [Ananas comosus]|nr:disease resistance protein RGA2-like isoform X2 [Ananas comosus]
MKELREKIGKIAKQRHDFGLAQAGPVRQAEFKRPETFSVVDEKTIVGRDGDKEKIVKLLLETGGDHDVSVIPIVGLGGLGKTTLAQLAFNDGRVTGQQRFDLRVWVYVSTNFDMKKIAKAVIDETEEKCNDLDNPDAVARCLVRICSQKRFLLVLDDVWNEDPDKWKELKVVFKDGKKGSKILVTTRSEKVATIMKTVEPHRVKGLSDDDCWTLFKRRAFDNGEENGYPNLVAIGQQIVKKCSGVPLAANALGSMMLFKRTEDAWSAIRDNEIWSLKEETTILPSLKLSYIQMPSALKQCFAYCSIFPKDYEIDKDDLIRQWIALGFISSNETWTSMEDIGNEYFNDLLWMSFLQDVEDEDDEKCYGNVTYRMHDLVHDLLMSVAREEVAVIVGEESTRIPKGRRYASIHYSSVMTHIPTTIARRLRALQFRKSSSHIMAFYSEAKYLRLLDLYGSEISMLPSSIGELKLLRYLNLSENSIQELPESITSLCNLQTLNLSSCCKICTLPTLLGSLTNLRILDLSYCSSLLSLPSSLCDLKNLHNLNLSALNSLVALPECIGSLQNLRILNLSGCGSLLSLPSSSSDLQHLVKLDISGCGKLCELPKMIQKLTKLRVLLNNNCSELKGMPRGIGKVVSLQELSVFVIGKQDRVEHCASISELAHLKLVGKLEINGLGNVTSPVDAKAANLIEKNLRSLKLVWNVLSGEEGMDTVLPAEEIDTVLENLQPHQKLENLKLEGYARGKFPSWMMNRIGSCLPNLVEIQLANIPRCSSLPPLGQLPFLKELTVRNMPAITNLGVDKFPALRSLELSCMPVLREWVTVLTVDDEEGRRERVPIFPCLTHLYLKECPKLRPEPCLPASVGFLTISGTSSGNLSLILERATPLDDGGDAADSLQPPPNKELWDLTIEKCQQLTCLPESLRSLTSLRYMTIKDCEDLERIEDWLGELADLRLLEIWGCSSLRYHKMTALEELEIKDCPLLLDADGQFVDTSVDHIKYVTVNESEYEYRKQASSSPQQEKSSPEEEESSPKEEEKKSWTSCWSKSNWLGSRT